VSTAAFLLLAKFSPNFGLKNMILINIKGFLMGKMAQICQISKKNKIQIARF
jgi:hypothetical protein